MLKNWNVKVHLLQKNLSSWNDFQLDTHRMAHPLLAKLKVRQMLYFTIFHTQYHLMQYRPE